MLRYAWTIRLAISSVMLPMIAYRATLCCQYGRSRTDRNRLMVQTKLAKETENFIGLIQALVASAWPSVNINPESTATEAASIQPKRESMGSVASRLRTKRQMPDGANVVRAELMKAAIQAMPSGPAHELPNVIVSRVPVTSCCSNVVPRRYVMVPSVLSVFKRRSDFRHTYPVEFTRWIAEAV